MRVEAKDLRGKRDVNLWDVVPLPFPWTLFIDVTNVCNFRCVFCPTGNPEMLKGTLRGRGHMTAELFNKIVNDLKDNPNLKIVNLYKDGEPLAHPKFTKLVTILKEANVTNKIWTKTNGTLIDHHPDLADCGLDMLGISVPGVTREAIYKVARVPLDYERYVGYIRKLYEGKRTFEMSIKIADTGLTDSEKDKFYNDFEHICEYISIEGLHGWSASDVKNMQIYDTGTFDGNPFDNKLACPLPFYMMTINYDGSVSVCNDDWGYYHQLGNINNKSIRQIWNSRKFKQFRMMHIGGKREKNKACATCQYINALPDNIDAHLEEMKRKLI
jgi:radical SAM protein with 4Fe4S-binding SPASM domain